MEEHHQEDIERQERRIMDGSFGVGNGCGASRNGTRNHRRSKSADSVDLAYSSTNGRNFMRNTELIRWPNPSQGHKFVDELFGGSSGPGGRRRNIAEIKDPVTTTPNNYNAIDLLNDTFPLPLGTTNGGKGISCAEAGKVVAFTLVGDDGVIISSAPAEQKDLTDSGLMDGNESIRSINGLYWCDDCDESFETKFRCVAHRKKAHVNEKETICSICKEYFKHRHQLWVHGMEAHSDYDYGDDESSNDSIFGNLDKTKLGDTFEENRSKNVSSPAEDEEELSNLCEMLKDGFENLSLKNNPAHDANTSKAEFKSQKHASFAPVKTESSCVKETKPILRKRRSGAVSTSESGEEMIPLADYFVKKARQNVEPVEPVLYDGDKEVFTGNHSKLCYYFPDLRKKVDN